MSSRLRGTLVLPGMILAVLLLVACDEDPPEVPRGCVLGEPGCAPTSSRLEPEEELALLYAPVLYLREQKRPCDREGGAYEPKPVEIVLDNPEVALRESNGTLIKFAPSAADLFAADPSTYLDFPGNPRRPGCRYERDYERFSEGEPTVAYAHIVPSEDGDTLALQYWFFYYFNDWNNKHEGDWERIQLTFEATSAREALSKQPVRMGYAGHSGGEVGKWDEETEREGLRPVVYVAAGSQASFFSPHVYVGRAESNEGLGCDDATPPHRRVPLEVRLAPTEVDGPDDPFAWLAYEGRWGQRAGPHFDGPLGPTTKDQWLEPKSWEESLRNSTLRVPAQRTFGPDAVDAFCATIGFVTHLFVPYALELPIVVGVVAVTAVLGVIVALFRTRYIPIGGEPLRKRRRLGQILTSAADVYRRRPHVFLGIGLLFVPATLLVGAVHWLAMNVSPVEPVVPVPSSSVWQELVLAFALAELQFGVVFTVVFAAATVSLAGYESGIRYGVRDSYREMVRRLPSFALPRILAIAAVAALAFTIIGLPLALWLAVHWTFVEQATLLDGRGGLRALRESASAVGADRRWSAASSLFLLGLGLVLPPAIGIIIILAYTSLPLFYVNLLTSGIYMALVPYLAIALAMVYFDLKLRVEVRE